MNQEQKIINYVERFGSITTLDAFRDLAITRLSARIFNIKKLGYKVLSVREKSKNRFGEDVNYSRYFIEKEQ
jgi:hypothetical protein